MTATHRARKSMFGMLSDRPSGPQVPSRQRTDQTPVCTAMPRLSPCQGAAAAGRVVSRLTSKKISACCNNTSLSKFVYTRALLHGTLAQSRADAAKQSQLCRLAELVVGLRCSKTRRAGRGICIG
ncbi:Piso0_000017 [Millerozyma farinosa CBS 7064]|uniref:Piso0_000017 protein n=1 Tax=Pichia sorbitophila (strain ATCC MYA-4447 / BCRC 22081 / CBS 7064 / NBRC 10061 / NRRL Y-12695) TaxID=559304 RepID=G8YSV7_PICSO|nr:Piso0_000017 [Millerozyma farinosa CBS 7064]